jgi:hypothetical protein
VVWAWSGCPLKTKAAKLAITTLKQPANRDGGALFITVRIELGVGMGGRPTKKIS